MAALIKCPRHLNTISWQPPPYIVKQIKLEGLRFCEDRNFFFTIPQSICSKGVITLLNRNNEPTTQGVVKTRLVKEGDFILSNSMSFGRPYIVKIEGAIHDGWLLLRINDKERIFQDYLYYILGSEQVKKQYALLATGGVVKNLNSNLVRGVKIPLPPLKIKQEIVAEIEDYRKIIDGARAVVENYKPQIQIDPEWEVVKLGDLCDFKNGLNFQKDSTGTTLKIVGVKDFQANLYAPLEKLNEVTINGEISDSYLLQAGDLLFVRSNGNQDLVGRSVIIPQTEEKISFSGFTIRGRFTDAQILPLFYAHFFKTERFSTVMKSVGRGANIRNLSQGALKELKIPLPDLETQTQIVAQIEKEQALVNANKELIGLFEQKIKDTISGVWGE